jgi:hypothetical protein
MRKLRTVFAVTVNGSLVSWPLILSPPLLPKLLTNLPTLPTMWGCRFVPRLEGSRLNALPCLRQVPNPSSNVPNGSTL